MSNLNNVPGERIADSILSFTLCTESILLLLKHKVTGFNPESGGRRAIDIETVDAAELLELMVELRKHTDAIGERINEAIRREVTK